MTSDDEAEEERMEALMLLEMARTQPLHPMVALLRVSLTLLFPLDSPSLMT